MTWAKLDDGFVDDPVLLRLPRGVRLLHVEAIVWCCRHLTDGVIEAHVLRRMTDEPEPDKAVDALVDAGLWEQHDRGFAIVDFLADQPSKEQVDERRERTRVRQERSRRHRDDDHSLCDPRWCGKAGKNGSKDGVSNAVTDGVSHDAPTRPARPVPPVRARDGEEGKRRASSTLRSPDLEECSHGRRLGNWCKTCNDERLGLAG